MPCRECLETFAAWAKATPCATCRPDYNPDAAPYMSAWNLVSDQWIVSGGIKYGLRLTAVATALDLLGYDDPEERLTLTDALQRMAGIVARLQNEKVARNWKK